MSCSLLQYPLRNCLALSLFINKKILLSDLDIDNDLNIVVYIAHIKVGVQINGICSLIKLKCERIISSCHRHFGATFQSTYTNIY